MYTIIFYWESINTKYNISIQINQEKKIIKSRYITLI